MWPVFVTCISLNNWPSSSPVSIFLLFDKSPAERVIVSDWTPPSGMSILFKIFSARFELLFTESINWFSSFCSNWSTLIDPFISGSFRLIWLWKLLFLKLLFVKHVFPFCSHWQGWCDRHLHLIASEGILFDTPSSIEFSKVSNCSFNGHNRLQYECWLLPFEQFHSDGIVSQLIRFYFWPEVEAEVQSQTEIEIENDRYLTVALLFESMPVFFFWQLTAMPLIIAIWVA